MMTKRKSIKRVLFFSILLVFIFSISFPQIKHQNQGISKAIGSPGNGQLQNPYLIDYKGSNFRYFSPMSYYILDMGYVHSKLYHTILEAYGECEMSCPDYTFRLMECARKKGGDPLLHISHQNGLSADFMIPKKKKQVQFKAFDCFGLSHYLLNANADGHIINNVELDFEIMARHILALDKAAKKNRLSINKIILQIDLKDDFFATPSGKLVKQKGIYFAKTMSPMINKMHDDHYHVDFKEI